MDFKISLVVTRLKQFCWHFIPPWLFLCALFSLYFLDTPLINKHLSSLTWMSFPSLAIASIIAWQFGRSRLVYGCLLLLAVLADKHLAIANELFDVKFSGIILVFLFLLVSKDRGFSFLNLCSSLVFFALIFVFTWFALPFFQAWSQPWLPPLNSLIFEHIPELRSLITPFNMLVLVIALFLGFIRLLFRVDNTHNVLYFALALSAVIHVYPNPIVNLLIAVYLAALFCYSILKDSFTMAFKDELTGIPSRRAMMQYVQTLGRKYTVVMSDIDHFKKFNDTYGHDVGDEVLKLVASKLNKVLGGGKAFRYGGEEFVIIFPRKTTEDVMPFVEVVRQTMADYDIAIRTKPRAPKPKQSLKTKLFGKQAVTKKPSKTKIVKVTSSFGVAQRDKTFNDFASIMKQADIALYAAKKAGRNCVKVAKQ